MKRTAREKLKEKHIKWKQVYTDKTSFLKEQYNDIIGPGSYFRFEGTADDGNNYYCILGPAKVHKPRAKWFAGVRKLPATYSAGGKYFDSMDSAASYAKETWGVNTPEELKPYTSAQLFGIGAKIDKWKAQREENEENKENKEDKEENLENKKSYNRSPLMSSFNLSKFRKEAMGYVRQENRPIYSWFNVNDLSAADNPEWQSLVEGAPSLSSVLREARHMHRGKGLQIETEYGLTSSQVEACLHTYVGYDVNFGAYILLVGPYLGKYYADSIDKFAFYSLRKGYTNEEELIKAMSLKMRKYSEKYGIDLNPEDLVFSAKERNPEEEGRQRGTHTNAHVFQMTADDPGYDRFFSSHRILGAGSNFQLSNRGLVKAMRHNWPALYERAVEELASSRSLNREEAEVVLASDSSLIESVYNSIKNKYNELAASGEAALIGLTEPPVLSDLKMVGKAGAQKTTTIRGKQKPLLRKLQINDQILQAMMDGENDPNAVMNRINANRSEAKKVPIHVVQSFMQDYNDRMIEEDISIEEVYSLFRENIDNLEQQAGGLTDLRTAFEAAKAHLGHNAFNLTDDFTNVTEDQVKTIRLAYQEALRAGEPWPPESVDGDESVAEGDVELELQREVGRVSPDDAPESIPDEDEARPVQTPATTPPTPAPTAPANDASLMDDIFSGTLNSLVKIAKELDGDGKKEASEEIKKIIRKYQKGK